MQFCHLTKMYVDKLHRIPIEAEIEANLKLHEYNSKYSKGSFLYGCGLIEKIKEKYKCQGSSGSRAGD